MKRILITAACLLLAACGGGPRYYGPPPPAPEEPPLRPYSEAPQPAPRAPEPYQPGPPPPVASAGPLKMASIGAYMDNQEQDLRRTLRGTGVLVARPGDDIVLNFRSDELFNGNSYELSERALHILAAIAPVLRHYDHTIVFIDGFTDTSGPAAKNLEVSRKRAYTVGGELVKLGVPLARLQARGYGEENLKIKTGDDVNEPRNRRIVIRISARASG